VCKPNYNNIKVNGEKNHGTKKKPHLMQSDTG